MASPRTVLALVQVVDRSRAWVAALARGDRILVCKLTLDRVGQPDLQPVLDLLDGDERAEQGRLVVVVPRFEDRDDQDCFASHVRCSLSSPIRAEMVELADGEVATLLGMQHDAASPLDHADVRRVAEQDLGLRLPEDLDDGAVRALAWLVAGKREVARREAAVRVVVAPASSPPVNAEAETKSYAHDAGLPPSPSPPAPKAAAPAAGAHLTVEQVASRLAVSVQTVRRLIDSAQLAVVRVGRQFRVRLEDVDAVVAQARQPTSHEIAVENRNRIHALGVRLPRRLAKLQRRE